MRAIHIMGLGAIGSNLIVQLVKRYPDMRFFGQDFDKVEPRNIGPQGFYQEHIGQPKALVIPAILGRYLRKFSYTPVNCKLTSSPFFEMQYAGDLFLDCFDNPESRKLLTDTKGAGEVLHIGFSPQYIAEIIWNENYDVPGEVDPARADICENPDAAAFISFVVSFASLVVMDFIDNGVKKNFIITQKYKIKEI